MLGNCLEETLETALFPVLQKDAWNLSDRQVRSFSLFMNAIVFDERRNYAARLSLMQKLLLNCHVSSLPFQIGKQLV